MVARWMALVVALTATVVTADDLVRVMSFNIRTSDPSLGTGEDSAGQCRNWYKGRNWRVVQQITKANPDFVGTQETSTDQKNYLDGQLAGTYTSIGRVSGRKNNNAEEFTAIWYKHGTWKVLSQGTIWLGPNENAQTSYDDMKYFRTATFGRFQHIATGKTVCMFNTHYEEPGKTEAQKHGTEIIKRRVSTECKADDRVTVVTGDLNAGINEQAIQMYLTDGWKEESSANTFNGGMTGDGCGQKFDYTLHKLANGVCLAKDEVLRWAFDGGCYPSDHAAKMATFCMEGSCCATPPPTTTSPAATTAAVPAIVTESQGNATVTSNESGMQATVMPSPAADSAVAPVGSLSGPTEISTQAQSTTGNSGTFMAVFGVVGVAAAVAGVVIKKKHGLDAMIGMSKNRSPNPWFFRSSDASALSPKRKSEENAARGSDGSSIPRLTNGSATSDSPVNRISRGVSSPVPTLGEGFGDEYRNRSISDSSSIACPRRTNDDDLRESSDRFTSFRMSSPTIMEERATANTAYRGTSRIYFGDLSII